MKTASVMMFGAAAFLAACGGNEAPMGVVAVEPTVVAAPTDYTVFFAFDRADLTAQGAQTVAEASTAANGATSVSVVGHTDTVGSVAYNQGLSEARAATVVGAMVGNGVNPAVITASGRSELDLAVPTADGVREQANRRVEISVDGVAVVEEEVALNCVIVASDGLCEASSSDVGYVEHN
ncbi:OmpA family protein [Roseobacter sp. HKCCA0434]|uniref:OmpA family protein n=1 Tax=Roseobacter sp. HKCCA0434 TaxID=3079297 RepID=UPI002905BBD9|nr:OmpA family protein [Roseobacter sp. HKCCA0434]